MVSVIIPLSMEPPPSTIFFDRVFESDRPEVIVAADSSAPANTLAGFEKRGAIVFTSNAPRGERLRQAASRAIRPILLFLHADTLLPHGWLASALQSIATGADGGAFRLSFLSGDPRMKWISTWANLRTKFTRVPYGDQAPFVRRDVYLELGGHAPWPLLEDVDFARRLKRGRRVVLLDSFVETSARRYFTRGVFRTVFSNWGILVRYHLGVSPEVLASEYRKPARE